MAKIKTNLNDRQKKKFPKSQKTKQFSDSQETNIKQEYIYLNLFLGIDD